MSNVMSSPELTYTRTPGKWSKLYAAILNLPAVYTARVNQTFSTFDQIIVIIYDTGSGTLANVLPDMEVWVGSSAGLCDKGICRLRDKDATHFYLSETSEIQFADNDYISIMPYFGIWARPVRITVGGTVYMDEITYTDQHTNWEPQPNMGAHKVAKLTGASVNVGFDASTSFCLGSSISTWAWSCATASGSSGASTSTVAFQFNTTGWHVVYLTVTGANSKSFFGVRYVFIWNEAHPPALADITEPGHVDVDSGGWKIGLRLFTGASLSDFSDRAMVILFSEDHYGSSQVDIGAVPGSEQIRFIGWISGESHTASSEAGSITFEASNGAFWMGKVPSWPDGVELANTATAWTQIASLTVDLGAFHFIHWRSTVSRVMDVSLSGDARITNEVSSSAQNLWAQLQEMTWAQIYARPGVNAQNQLSIKVIHNLIPTGSRATPTVMAITTEDITDEVEFDRVIIPEVGIVDMSGLVVTAPNTAQAKFALSPGHSLPHFGAWDIQTNLLLSDQAQVITLAGLWRAWRNNLYPSIPLKFASLIGKLDCFPNMKCTVSGLTSIRGAIFSGGLIPTSLDLVYDATSGYLHTEANFEAETFESTARQGDTPGSGSTDNPPNPSFPPLPPITSPLPGVPTGSVGGPSRVLFLDASGGLIYTENFNAASPTYVQVNSGLSFVPFSTGSLNGVPVYRIITKFFVTPSGAVYAFKEDAITQGTWASGNRWFGVWRAPSVGGTFVPIFDWTTVNTAIGAPGFSDNARGLYVVAPNNTLSDQVMYITHELADEANIYLGNGGTFSKTDTRNYATLGAGAGSGAYVGLSFGANKWIAAKLNGWYEVSTAGVFVAFHSQSNIGVQGFDPYSYSVVRAGTTGKTFFASDFPTDRDLFIGTNNMSSVVIVTPPSAQDFTGFACDPSGTYICARYSSGKAKSTDGGSSWASLSSLPVGNWFFGYGGPGTSLPRFIAAGASIQYSEDMFSTFTAKLSSSYTAINPTPNIVGLQVLGY